MRAEIIAIGDELVSGQRLDTNSQWLSRELGDIGVPALFHTTVGDDLQANIEVLRIAAKRADIVVCTGGLGPTLDDLTRQAMAEAFEQSFGIGRGFSRTYRVDVCDSESSDAGTQPDSSHVSMRGAKWFRIHMVPRRELISR